MVHLPPQHEGHQGQLRPPYLLLKLLGLLLTAGQRLDELGHLDEKEVDTDWMESPQRGRGFYVNDSYRFENQLGEGYAAGSSQSPN